MSPRRCTCSAARAGGPCADAPLVGRVFVRARRRLPWWLLRDVTRWTGGGGDRQARSRSCCRSPAAGSSGARDRRRGRPFQVGRSVRNFNVPTWCSRSPPVRQPRFSFERRDGSIEGRSFVEIAFRDRGPDGRARPRRAPGRARRGSGLDSRRGRHAGPHRARSRLPGTAPDPRHPPTAYRPYQALALWVPVETRDASRPTRGRTRPVRQRRVRRGLAAYTNFRQAGVSTQEEIRAPEPDPR